MSYDKKIFINTRCISIEEPSYFIADLASNHDGELSRAKELIFLAKEVGADAVKFQHFLASKIVSDYGFKNLKTKLSHQSNWKKSVYEIYEQYECNRSWIEELVKTAKQVNIDFLSTPYDIDAVDLLDAYVSAYKIGSGDITWIDFFSYIAKKKKPIFLATGAADMNDVRCAVEAILAHTSKVVLMQCNTNYTGSKDNFNYINLNVLKTYAELYPGMVLGLSDHTPGHATVLGAIALGARVIEKHFTDDNAKTGPDHAFSMNPRTWQEMIERSRELEAALGDGIKRVQENEKDTLIVQQRCLRVVSDIRKGEVIKKDDLEILRPAPEDSMPPYELENVVGNRLLVDKQAGDAILSTELEEL